MEAGQLADDYVQAMAGRPCNAVGAESLGRSPVNMSRLKLKVVSIREVTVLPIRVMLPGTPLIGRGNVRSRSVSTAGASDIWLLSALVMQCFARCAVHQTGSLVDCRPGRS